MLKGIEEGATYFYHPDHLGSVSVVSNHKGMPYERVEYLPFGEVWIEDVDPATSYIPFRFTSKELDRETGLYYYGARYYEPRVSRWMSADPAGWKLVSPMDEDGEPVPDGWPEGFGPDPSVGMRPDYSVVEATNWYAYVSNNPVKYVDPTGMDDITIGVQASLAAGDFGGHGGFGIVIDTDDLGESGFYFEGGESKGGGLSGSLHIQYTPGEAEGDSASIGIDIPFAPPLLGIAVEGGVTDSGEPILGVGISLGAGLTSEKTITKTLTIKKIGEFFAGLRKDEK